MTDHAPLVVAFFVERPDDDAEPEVLWAEMVRRWPALTREEAARGVLIAQEILAGRIAEGEAMREAVAAEIAKRRAVAEAIAGFGEAEFREIADGAGLPLDAVRKAMQALQRGDPVPMLDDGSEEEGR